MKRVEKVFLTGGTGFVGGAVLSELLSQGYKVTCLVRPAAGPTPGAERIEGNVWQPGLWMEKLKGHDAVIHLVGIIKPEGDNTFERAHVQAIEIVSEAAREGGVKKLVHMSALGARPESKTAYHETKWKGEEIVRWAGPAWTIFRPSLIFGPRGELVESLRRLVSLPVVPTIGSGEARFQPVFVGDVARCVVQSLDDRQTDAKAVELGGPDVLSFNRMLDVVREATGRRSRVRLHVPVGLARAHAAVMEAVLPRPPLTRDQVALLSEDSVCDMEPARRLFGPDWTSFSVWCGKHLS